MAWNPDAFNAGNLMDYTREFCRQQFGNEYADEAARILNLYCKYCARVTAEMLDHKTYNLQVVNLKLWPMSFWHWKHMLSVSLLCYRRIGAMLIRS